ncbi:MAG: AAA family ATPase [Neptunomonas phycophila]|uniref:AAA family ATPase n=1 Tax=Neptunomonas phycophila TaxID=1572645 RepID=UPI003B8BE2DF
MTYKTKVINLFGGAGIGKSTIAARLFSELKMQGREVELVPEYAKEMVWENRQPILDEQLYVFAKQYRRISRLIGKVEYVITDSPVILGIIYTSDDYFKNLEPLILEAHDSFDNINIMLDRTAEYNPHGRQQTKEEAIIIDQRLRTLLSDRDDLYHTVTVNGSAHDTILKRLWEIENV